MEPEIYVDPVLYTNHYGYSTDENSGIFNNPYICSTEDVEFDYVDEK